MTTPKRNATGGARPRGRLRNKIFLSPATLTFDLYILTLARFLYNAPNSQFHHPTFNRSEVIVLTNKLTSKQTDAAENIHLAPLCQWVIKVGFLYSVTYTANQNSALHNLGSGS